MEADEAARRDGSALSEVLGPAPERDLVERLRSRRNFMSTDAVRWYMTATPDGDCEEAAAEIERLRGAVAAERTQRELVFAELLKEQCEHARARYVLRELAEALDNADSLAAAAAMSEADALLGPNVANKLPGTQ